MNSLEYLFFNTSTKLPFCSVYNRQRMDFSPVHLFALTFMSQVPYVTTLSQPRVIYLVLIIKKPKILNITYKYLILSSDLNAKLRIQITS